MMFKRISCPRCKCRTEQGAAENCRPEKDHEGEYFCPMEGVETDDKGRFIVNEMSLFNKAIKLIKKLALECDGYAEKYEKHPELPNDNSFTLSDLYIEVQEILSINKTIEGGTNE